jgi:HAMP domain-containing protein
MSEPTSPLPAKTQKKAIFIGLRAKLILVLAALFLLTFSVIFYWVDGFVTDLAMRNLQTDLIATAKTAAIGVDGNVHEKLFKSGQIDDPSYNQIAELLRTVKNTNPRASGIYTYTQLPDKPNQVQLVVSAALPPGAPQPVTTTKEVGGCLIPAASRPTLGEDYTDISPTMIAGLKTAGAETSLYSDKWGTWLSGYAPIYNSQGQPVGAVGVDMCASEVIDLQRNIRSNTLLAMGITLFILIIAVGFIATGVTRPVMELTRVADLIGLGDYNQDFSHLYSTRVQDEVGKLANVFELMAGKVYTREQTLRARVEQLEIMIDEGKRDHQVQEIVESDFFQELQVKVQNMRNRFAASDKPGTKE